MGLALGAAVSVVSRCVQLRRHDPQSAFRRRGRWRIKRHGVQTDRTAFTPGSKRSLREFRRSRASPTLRSRTTTRRFKRDIRSFSTTVAGRGRHVGRRASNVALSERDGCRLYHRQRLAAYLGVETSGVTGSTFGGRSLTEDMIDLSLGAIFGNVSPRLSVVPDDGKESPCLTNDHVRLPTIPRCVPLRAGAI